MKRMKKMNEGIEKTKWWKATKIEGLPITWGAIAIVILFVVAITLLIVE